MMRLLILHGRDDPNQDLDYWGYSGPTLREVVAIHGTYGRLNVFFGSETAAVEARRQTGWARFCDLTLTMRFQEDLLVLTEPDGFTRYYGDWELQADRFGSPPWPDTVRHSQEIPRWHSG